MICGYLKSKVSLVLFCLILKNFVFAQSGLLQLANEYYADAEFLKARTTYEEILKDSKKWDIVYPNYLLCLYQLNDLKTAEKTIKRMMKTYPDYMPYKVDLIECLEKQGKKDEAKKQEEKVINETVRSSQLVSITASYLVSKNKSNAAEQIFLRSRKYYADEKLFANELAEIYKVRGDKPKLMKELLIMIQQDELEKIKNQLQNYLNDEEDFQNMETALIERIQENPENRRFTDLLIWLYIQQKDFDAAFIQARAQDKRLKLQGSQMYDIQKIAFENDKNEAVVKYYQYLIQEYPKSQIANQSKLLSIKSREKIISNQYPVNQAEVKILVNDYKSLLPETRLMAENYEIQRNIATLQAFYLNQTDSAIFILQNLVKQPKNNETQMAKLLLADIYLLTGEPWESALLYMQVEKERKDDLIAYEAKFKNAKLFFFNHEFELATEQLNILKQATSREIANDAMQLSLLISMALAEDSNTAALEIFATAYFNNQIRRYETAMKNLQQLEQDFKNNALSEEINWMKFNIFKKSGKIQEALECLEKIEKNPSSNTIYSDDAMYETARIYEENLKQKDKAMEYYQKLISTYPGSVFVVESRKRIRLLRGDKSF
ncbi:MAG: tetratricopeptide repeat protein [Cytophagales bacterium]